MRRWWGWEGGGGRGLVLVAESMNSKRDLKAARLRYLERRLARTPEIVFQVHSGLRAVRWVRSLLSPHATTLTRKHSRSTRSAAHLASQQQQQPTVRTPPATNDTRGTNCPVDGTWRLPRQPRRREHHSSLQRHAQHLPRLHRLPHPLSPAVRDRKSVV